MGVMKMNLKTLKIVNDSMRDGKLIKNEQPDWEKYRTDIRIAMMEKSSK
jgi:hypothetical protein